MFVVLNTAAWFHSEVYNAGNSARLLLSTCPEVTSLYVYGLAGDEERLCCMLRQAQQQRHSVVVLFPSAEAITTDQLKTGNIEPAAGEEDHPLNIILLDGTWSQVNDRLCPASMCLTVL